MADNAHDLDVEPDEDGTFLVRCKNKKKLLCDGLYDTFTTYGKIASVTDKGHRNIHIKFYDKESALNCFHDLGKNPDFMVDLPHKFIAKKEEEDHEFNDILMNEARMGFQKLLENNERHVSRAKRDLENHYVRKKRRILESRAFKRFIFSLASCSQYIRVREDRESLVKELIYQLRGVSLDFFTGFFEDNEDDSSPLEIPALILAKDLYYFGNINAVCATDILVCNLPPWYQEIDVYKLMLPLVPDDYLGLDWYRLNAGGTKECSFPYVIIYLKTRYAACKLRYCVDGLIIDHRRISVCLMEDVENILVEVRNSIECF